MKRVNVFAVIREMREQIVKTMQDRGIKEIVTCMSYAEWCKENKREPEEDETDDNDYRDYINCDAPYVVFFDKYHNGIDYRVDKVTLKTNGLGLFVLEFDCVNDEWGYDDTFREDDMVFLTLYNVYDALLDKLGVEDEPEKVMVLYEVDEDDNTKTSIVAMTETDWNKRKPETIEKVLRDYFDERYADCDDDYFCYEDEIKQAVAALAEGYETEFNGSPLFWDGVEIVK